MFAPKGYTPLSALMRRVPDSLREEVEEMMRVFATDHEQGDGWVVGLLSGTSPLDVIEYAVLHSLGDNACIAGRGGEVLTFDLQSMMGRVRDLWEYTVEDLLKARRLSQGGVPVSEDYAVTNLIGDWGIDEMIATFMARGDRSLVDWLDDSVCFFDTHQTLPMFLERQGYTVSLDTFEILGRHPEFRIEDFNSFRKVLRPFEGWAICVDAEFAKDGWAPALWTQMERQRASFGAGLPPMQRNGRPNVLIRAATEAYRSLYPQGHGDTSKKALRDQISERIGKDVSPRTLDRVIEASAKPPEPAAKSTGR